MIYTAGVNPVALPSPDEILSAGVFELQKGVVHLRGRATAIYLR